MEGEKFREHASCVDGGVRSFIRLIRSTRSIRIPQACPLKGESRADLIPCPEKGMPPRKPFSSFLSLAGGMRSDPQRAVVIV